MDSGIRKKAELSLLIDRAINELTKRADSVEDVLEIIADWRNRLGLLERTMAAPHKHNEHCVMVGCGSSDAVAKALAESEA